MLICYLEHNENIKEEGLQETKNNIEAIRLVYAFLKQASKPRQLD